MVEEYIVKLLIEQLGRINNGVYPVCWIHGKFSIIRRKGCVRKCQIAKVLL